jgi:hypothetical protein
VAVAVAEELAAGAQEQTALEESRQAEPETAEAAVQEELRQAEPEEQAGPALPALLALLALLALPALQEQSRPAEVERLARPWIGPLWAPPPASHLPPDSGPDRSDAQMSWALAAWRGPVASCVLAGIRPPEAPTALRAGTRRLPSVVSRPGRLWRRLRATQGLPAPR